MNPGSQSVMEGKVNSRIMTKRSQPRKGSAALYMSPIVVSLGATPFITKRLMPNGGEVPAISIFRRKRTPNQTSLYPRFRITGTKMGRTIIIMDTTSMKPPRNRMMTCMIMTITIGGRERFEAISLNPALAPLKARTWLYHYNDGDKPDAQADGFLGFVLPRQTFVF